MISATDVLSVPENDPDRLFRKHSYRELMKVWHPDVCSDPRAKEVTAWINRLHQSRSKIVERRISRGFDFGTETITDDLVRYDFSDDDAFTNTKRTLTTLGSPDRDDRSLFPSIVDSGDNHLSVSKTRGTHTLSDVVRTCGFLSPFHASWIITGLLRVCEVLAWDRRSHSDISASNVFVRPELYEVSLLGGWWYSAPFGETLTRVSNRTAGLLPRRVMDERKIENSEVDLTLVKVLGQEVLGFRRSKPPLGTPVALADFLTNPPARTARAEMDAWRRMILPAFVNSVDRTELTVNETSVYS